MDGIFISYRRDDSAGYAGRLYDRLIPHFGAERVFMDVEGIEPGADFVTAIEDAVGSCRVLVVIIGDEWLSTTDKAGGRRLDDPHDFIRLETVTALQRGIRVVPVLVGGALMPRAEDLPEDLKPLARRQAIEVSHKQWDATTAELIAALETILSLGASREPMPQPLVDTVVPEAKRSGAQQAELGQQTIEPRNWRWVGGVAAALLLLVAGGWVWLAGDRNEDEERRATNDTLMTAQVSPEGRTAAGASVPTPPATVIAAATPPVTAPATAPTATRPTAMAARVPPPRDAAPVEAPATVAPASDPAVATPAPVPAPPPKPAIRSFQAQADPRGARLCYSVAHAESLTLSPQPGELTQVVKDCVTVAINEPTTFTITARNAEGVARKSISVAPRPVATPTPLPEATRPVAEPGIAVGAPRAGESWTYRTSGKWPTSPKRSIVISVQSVANGVVTDGLSAEGLASDSRRSNGARPMFMSWPGIGNEFSPYLAAFIDMNRMDTMRGFATPDMEPNWGQWYSEAKLIGQETVNVPAGSFQAHKVEVWSSRHATGGPTMAAIEPVRVHYLIWYAPGAKRYVKMQRRILSASGTESERDVFELVARR
ncbi:toll/interleukin-1 receptor domain-containing protein [Hydrogenophaga sp.]|uniref:toll/interleukin-1 receptor domain-containing protein n=1 Tax=Hydrogenophaga sp. TaxID=1904254 RepID=UPI00271F42CB|nr:toll/interleukin-1 receptor domain-containing protein [Hydrogenophaga sp.]MDO9438769.1 toll/interleukin-1 receptor domain-containing protein [Hydrogenophaga sp.]